MKKEVKYFKYKETDNDNYVEHLRTVQTLIEKDIQVLAIYFTGHCEVTFKVKATETQWIDFWAMCSTFPGYKLIE